MWATFLGGDGDDDAYGISVSSNGFVSLCGHTKSSNFPVTASAAQPTALGGAGQTNAFVSRLDPNGTTLLYGTYYGGLQSPWTGPGATWANAIVVDANGKITFVGGTECSDLTMVNAYDTTFGGTLFPHQGADPFVAQINPYLSGSASLLYSTYVGGTANLYDCAFAVDVNSGNIYLGGSTESRNFDATTGLYPAFQVAPNSHSSYLNLDCFVTILNPSLTGSAQLIYSTYLGSTYDDELFGLVAPMGVINCCGYTRAPSGSASTGILWDFPISTVSGIGYPGGAADAMQISPGHGGRDAFLAQLDYQNSNQQLRYSTFLGGDADDVAQAIARVSDQCDLVVGSTSTVNTTNSFPTTPGAYRTTWTVAGTDAFLSRIDWTNNPQPTSAQLNYSTFIGGNVGIDIAYCVVLDAADAYVGGSTMSSDFPTTPGAFDQSWNGAGGGGNSWGDGFVLKLSLPGFVH